MLVYGDFVIFCVPMFILTIRFIIFVILIIIVILFLLSSAL